MDLNTARKAFSTDRIFILGLIQFLLGKKIISSSEDLTLLREYCRATLNAFRTAQTPVTSIQLDEAEIELEHIFKSFRKPERPIR